jgi:uncharacterized short protein YbdD (DUF466 family)
MQCLAQFRVDATEKLRTKIGIANYNEYVKDLEEKHGKEKATEIIDEPMKKLKGVEAALMLHRMENNQHPKAIPKTQQEMQDWTHADQVRSEMGEKAWWESVRVVSVEFGPEKVDRLFGVKKEAETAANAIERIVPGANVMESSAKVLETFNKVMEPVREAAPEAKSVDDISAAFKKVYPTEADLKKTLSKLSY